MLDNMSYRYLNEQIKIYLPGQAASVPPNMIYTIFYPNRPLYDHRT